MIVAQSVYALCCRWALVLDICSVRNKYSYSQSDWLAESTEVTSEWQLEMSVCVCECVCVCVHGMDVFLVAFGCTTPGRSNWLRWARWLGYNYTGSQLVRGHCSSRWFVWEVQPKICECQDHRILYPLSRTPLKIDFSFRAS